MRISDWSSDVCSSDLTLDISLTKLAGLWATWGLIALLYATMRYYWEGNYAFSMNLLETVAPWLLLVSVPYMLWLDRRMIEPRDGCWQFGRWLIEIGRASCRESGCQYV